MMQESAVEAAHDAGLRYVGDETPGIARRRDGEHFVYVDARGKPVNDEKTLARIKHLAIPPAYEDVWICARADGHLQATGRDARGRKQYRYHARWREVRDEAKYERMIAFGHALPAVRARLERDLGRPGLPREKVIATVIELLEATSIRVGNDEYARANHSYGLTTMQSRHVRIDGTRLLFTFRGKSGVRHAIDVRNRKLARIVKTLRDLPGQELFHFVDDEGISHRIDSGDVNAYLHDVTGKPFTAKDFRTWAGTIACALALSSAGADSGEPSAAELKRRLNAAIGDVAKMLGNTPAVCRKCYIHPAVIERYLNDGGFPALHLRQAAAHAQEIGATGLRDEEKAILKFLEAAGGSRP